MCVDPNETRSQLGHHDWASNGTRPWRTESGVRRSARQNVHGELLATFYVQLVSRAMGRVEAAVAWLGSLSGALRARYEAGRTGFWLYQAAVAAGIAPGKTPGAGVVIESRATARAVPLARRPVRRRSLSGSGNSRPTLGPVAGCRAVVRYRQTRSARRRSTSSSAPTGRVSRRHRQGWVLAWADPPSRQQSG